MRNPYFVQNYNERFEVTQIEDDWLLLNLKNFTLTKLDQLGAICWNILSEAQTLNMLAEAVRSTYFFEDDVQEFKASIQEQVDYLLSEGLIQYVS